MTLKFNHLQGSP